VLSLNWGVKVREVTEIPSVESGHSSAIHFVRPPSRKLVATWP
jgi:hypothetical protein